MKASIFFFIILLNSNALGDFSRGHAYEVYQERDLVEQRKAYKNAISLLRNSQFANFSKEKEKLKNYILYPYLDFNEKIYRISRYKEKQIIKFLEDYRDTPLGQPLLSHWLPVLAKRGHWTVFLRNYGRLINPSKEFKGSTGKGLYADVITEIDFSVGRVLKALDENGLSENTIVVFTSDNGPWLSYGDHAGSSGIFREGKGTAWEGGQRVPCIVKYPNKINSGTVIDEPLMGIDWLPTFANVTGSRMSSNKIDGKNIWPLLISQTRKSPHEALYFYYRANELHAVRSGEWKLYFPRSYRSLNGKNGGKDGIPVKYEQNVVNEKQLYNLKEDPSELKNIVNDHPNIVSKLEKMGNLARYDLGDKLTNVEGTGTRDVGTIKL